MSNERVLDAMLVINREYGNHPCGPRFCRKCDWPMLPPAYPGDYWDCNNNNACAHTRPPSEADVRKMWS